MIRRILWFTIITLALLALVGAGAIAWLLLKQRPQPAGLVVVSDDSRMRLIQADGKERSLAENVDATQYRFPAVAPDGRNIAYIATDGDALLVVRLNLASGERTELYRSSVNRPFDLAWSPDGRYVIFLAASATSLTTNIVPADGAEPARLIATGQQSFFAWHPHSKAILLHENGHTVQGGRIEVYQPGQERSSQILDDPGFFQAPAWSVDGKSFFYVAQPPITNPSPTIDDVESSIVRVSADGKDPRVLASEKRSDLRIVRAPTSDQLAYVTLQLNASGDLAWGALKLIGASGGEPRTISRPDEHVTTFFWSPDGKQIAYLTHTDAFSRNGPRTWRIVDVASGAIRDLTTFTPSQAFADLQIFFDAYLFSFSPWSPDNTRLAYGTADGVYVLDVASGAAMRVTDGTLGMWIGGT